MRELPPLTGARILIVDDEPANVRLLERLLAGGGFTEVRSTTNPTETLAIMEAFTPDLIMLDLNMPGMDGFAVMEAIKQRRADKEFLPVLVLTADTTQVTRERALSGGATDFLTKPIDRTEVLLRTCNLLESRFLHLALRTENDSLGARLVHQAFHDSLTGLANRALFRERVEHALSRTARGARSALLFLDLDDFKNVNDSLGHAEGDRLLQVVSARLLSATRGCDTVARLGGDEFGVLVEDIGHESDALIIVNRITEAMRAPVDLVGRQVTIGVTIGVAHARAEDAIDELVRNADVAMYRAKAAGKGGYAVFEPGMYAARVRQLELTDDLRHAITRGELRLLYQPIVNLQSGAITGVEALIRWRRQSHDEQAPAMFIPVAEETGLIVPIGRWVLDEACRQARHWEGDTPNAPGVSINISAHQLHDPKFVEDVATTLSTTGLPAHQLTLEITESVLVGKDAVIDRLREIRALGVRLAIDDFGTGYSNLGYLHRFPVDVLKIDRSFVTHVTQPRDAGFARMIIGLADALQLKTVAEGIETREQRHALVAMGCENGQGFLFARPSTPDQIGERLAAQSDRATTS